MPIANINSRGKTFSPADASHRSAPYFKLGWQDKAVNLPFPKVYDTWPPFAQTAYEKGRLMSLCVFKSLGLWTASPNEKNYEMLAALAQEYFDMQTEMQLVRENRKAELERAQLAEHGICEVY